VSAGYVTGAMFVASVSAIYLLLGKHIEIARRSITVAVSFGLASALSVVVLGDASGYTATDNQKMKIAAIEAMWETEPPPGVLPRIDRTDSESALVALGAGVHPAAPLDRRRGGLGRRGSRPPAMGRRRRSADFSRGVEHFGEQCSRHCHWLHRICRHLSHELDHLLTAKDKEESFHVVFFLGSWS
jgi:Cytochrome bd terminal oxidase subunit I